MQVKITLSDGTTVKTEIKTTKKSIINQYSIGSPIQVLGIYKNIQKVEFPSLSLSRSVLKDIQNRIHELGDYFDSFSEFEDKLREILDDHDLFIKEIIDTPSNIVIVNLDGETIENLMIHFCSTFLDSRASKRLEIIKYNCYMI